jgi:CheY-like chemotaxis protein
VQIRDHFLAVLSHELRNPLAALTAGLYLLKPDGRTGTALQSHEMMERQLKLLVRLVDDLLEVSRITTGKLVLRKQPVDFNAVLNDAVDACRPMILRLGHELTFTAPEGEIILEADPTRLAQVFMNLLNNAAEYSERGHIAVHAERRGSEVVVRVSDTGIGISAAQLPHVFDAFMQVEPAGNRAHAGLGIGLSLVKEFVVLHGGSVEAHSEGPGKGSEFVVRLPASSSVAVAEVEPVAETAPRGPRRRILIVEDNRDAAESLAMLLKLTGHQVQVAYDGNEGVAAAAEFRPELVLMDLGMPHMDGYEAARRMRAGPGGDESILVALTGWGADHDRRRAQESGFDQHLIKPVDPDALTRMIEQMPIKPS